MNSLKAQKSSRDKAVKEMQQFKDIITSQDEQVREEITVPSLLGNQSFTLNSPLARQFVFRPSQCPVAYCMQSKTGRWGRSGNWTVGKVWERGYLLSLQV